jgi:hypothetical protein
MLFTCTRFVVGTALVNGRFFETSSSTPDFEPVLGKVSAVFVMGNDFDELKTVFDDLAVGAERALSGTARDHSACTDSSMIDSASVDFPGESVTIGQAHSRNNLTQK